VSIERPHIALIVASTRTTRFADPIAAWVQQTLEERGDLDLDVLDIREVALPTYDPERLLGQRFDAADGYLIVTHEFNHGYSAPLKNVLDHYFAEFEHKPVAFVGYGNVGGSRAIEQLRQVIVELNMVSVRESVHIFGAQFPAIRAGGDTATEALATLEPRFTTMTDHLLWWAHALTAARWESA
jgi:NAD(P)H-dependent FMN reductase